MNILYLSGDLGIPIRGHKGAAVHIRAMVDAFSRAGHCVTILTPCPGAEDGTAPQGKIIQVNLPPSQINDPDHSPQERQAQAANEALITLAQGLLSHHRFDLIYERHSLWSNAGARLKEETGLPLVLEVNAPLRREAMQYRRLADTRLAAQREAQQFMAADFLAVVSNAIAAYVVANGAQPDRVHLLPNAVDPQLFHPAVRGGAVRHRYGLHHRIVVGFSGRVRPWHDLDTLIRAFARLHAGNPAYHLLLVGEVPAEISAAIKMRGLSEAVTLTGAIPHRDVPEHLAAMDVAVSSHASLEDFYFSPLKLFEYLACGVPTVAADVGQPGQLIHHGQHGYLYPPGDDLALANAVLALVENPAHAREAAWQGATMVLENYTWDKNAARVLSWLTPPAVDSSLPTDEVLSLPILDHKLRQRLYRATRPDLTLPLLVERLPFLGKNGTQQLKQVTDIKVLKYKPGRRCVLAYQLACADKQTSQPSQIEIIGKVFRDERGSRLFALQEALWNAGFGASPADMISVPRPLAYVPKMRMLLQDKAPGKTLNELVLQSPIQSLVARCAEGLAKLHNSRAFDAAPAIEHPAENGSHSLLQSYFLEDELRNLNSYTENLRQFKPESYTDVVRLKESLFAWAGTLPQPGTAAPIHRDFYYSQVLFDGPRLTLIDFDLISLGDPAIDVANFSAHLHFLGLDHFNSLDTLHAEAEHFLKIYARCRQVDESFLRRLAFYQAATFFRLLNVVAPRPALRHHFEPLFNHAAQSISNNHEQFPVTLPS